MSSYVRDTKLFLKMIKLEHTVFALPFVLIAAVVAATMTTDRFPDWTIVGWITLAMVGARSMAMGLNRVIDAGIDRLNPRTAHRAIPSGTLSRSAAWLGIVASGVLFVVATSFLHPICAQWMPLALICLIGYSYTKRFTWLCHFFLGGTIALAPMGAWMAVTGTVALATWVLWLAVMLWIAGFDMLYALQDRDFDQAQGLYSIPARFGVVRTLIIARCCHAGTMVLLVWFGSLAALGVAYGCGVVLAGGLLWFEHRWVRAHDLSRLRLAFFSLNGTLSVVLMVLTIGDRWWAVAV